MSKRLVDGVFECLASAELRHLGGFDLDGGASSWIAASASRTFAHGEGSKTNECNGVAFFQHALDAFNESLKRATSGHFGDVRFFGDVFDEFRLVHKIPLCRKVVDELLGTKAGRLGGRFGGFIEAFDLATHSRIRSWQMVT